ncbi:hypothetical protein MA20_31255 [Bradyrhizobium japonicum]|uniref:Uncharacterized protein n=2 Tax=Bradyrhizobium japonicum TaxID=375 RepID=A0A0A3XQY9_BRAJP|nr:hypothetical protein MA20_31255 [Bradyrhizobium japonicum]
MQIRSKAHLLMVSHLRGLRALLASAHDPAVKTSKEASSLLIFIAVVLTLLLAILEVDQHRATLQSLGLLGDLSSMLPNLMGP